MQQTCSSQFPIQQTCSSQFLSQPFSIELFRMRPSRRSRHLTAWTTPSAFQQDPAFIDPAPTLELRDTHFFTAGNHLILHPLDFYLLKNNHLLMKTYVDKQFDFWSTISETLQSLRWKLGTYTLHLAVECLSESTTRRTTEDIEEICRQISHVQTEETEWIFPHLLHPPVHIFERLVEEVKHPPPFIPKLTRRHSFS